MMLSTLADGSAIGIRVCHAHGACKAADRPSTAPVYCLLSMLCRYGARPLVQLPCTFKLPSTAPVLLRRWCPTT